MRAPWRRAAALTVASCGICLLPLISGCKTDVDKTDELVAADFETATQDLDVGKTEDAIAALKRIPGAKGGSPESQIESNLLLAQAETDSADKLRQDIETQEVQIAAVVGRMDGLGAQIALNNLNIASYQGLNPQKGGEALTQAMNAAEKGTENGAWVKGSAPIPSLTDAKQRQENLQKQINDLTQQKEELSKKQQEALGSAGKFDQQADSSTGKESVGFFIQAANQRKEAADDATRMQQLDAQIAPLQQDLQTAKLQQQFIEASIAGFQQQQQQLQAGWQNVQKQIEGAKSFSDLLVRQSGSPPTTAPAAASEPGAETGTSTSILVGTLDALAGELDQRVKALQEKRGSAVGLLNSAFGHYTDALGVADKRGQELTKWSSSPDAAKLPEKRAWQALLALNSTASIKLRQANVKNRLGSLFTGEYVESGRRNRLAQLLAPVLKESGVTLAQPLSAIISAPTTPPAEVQQQASKVEKDAIGESPAWAEDAAALDQLASSQTSPAAQQAIARSRAALSYAWADSLLNDVIGNPGQNGELTANMAHAARMANQYAWSQLSALMGQTQAADTHLHNALDERKNVADANARNLLPAVLPPGLEFPVTAATQPTTEPTTEPTSAPVEGAPTTQPAVPGQEGATPATEPAPANPPAEAATQPAQPPQEAAPQTQEGTAPPPPANPAQETPAQRRSRRLRGR